MDELIEVFGFIIAIAIFIISAMRKTKQQPLNNRVSTEASIESLFGIAQETNVALEPQVVESKVDSREYGDEVFNKKDIIPNEGIDVIQDTIKENEIKNMDTSENAFDLRKAVVYTEILKRKYF